MFDLQTAKQRLNIPPADTTQNNAIQAALDAVLAFAEKYCDRQFLYSGQRVSFYYFTGRVLQLHRYPIDQILQVSQSVGDYKVHRIAGQIEFPGNQAFDEITIDYTGGYQPLPADLEMAFWMIFDDVYGAVSGTGGISAGGVKSVRVGEISVAYDTGAQASSGGGLSLFGMPNALVKSVLDLYKLQAC